MSYNLVDLDIRRYLKNDNTVVLVYNNVNGKEHVFKRLSEFNNELGLRLASAFYKNNNITGFVYDDNKLVGYTEDYITNRIYGYNQNEKGLFLQHCEENIFLTEFGYFNFDSATINFFKDINVGFDKSAVTKLVNINKKLANWYIIIFQTSYSSLDINYAVRIQEGILTKDNKKLNKILKEIYNEITSL